GCIILLIFQSTEVNMGIFRYDLHSRSMNSRKSISEVASFFLSFNPTEVNMGIFGTTRILGYELQEDHLRGCIILLIFQSNGSKYGNFRYDSHSRTGQGRSCDSKIGGRFRRDSSNFPVNSGEKGQICIGSHPLTLASKKKVGKKTISLYLPIISMH
ncbi:hypothetical protein CEXT_369031, partial [Caerostris extrusa]